MLDKSKIIEDIKKSTEQPEALTSTEEHQKASNHRNIKDFLFLSFLKIPGYHNNPTINDELKFPGCLHFEYALINSCI